MHSAVPAPRDSPCMAGPGGRCSGGPGRHAGGQRGGSLCLSPCDPKSAGKMCGCCFARGDVVSVRSQGLSVESGAG